MFHEIHTPDELERLIQSEAALLVYFSTGSCNVCKSLKPKVDTAVQNEFPEIKAVYVPSDVLPEVAGQHRVFTAPVVLVFFHGRETIRKIRTFSVEELVHEIRRPYSIVFSE